jgi:hypothetical protein
VIGERKWKNSKRVISLFEFLKCSVDANYKEELKTMLARWQCEKVSQVIDPGRMQKEKTRRKICAKTGV